MLLCPIQGRTPPHWTLLVKDSSSWRYYETLGTLHKDCHQRAVALISLFDSVEKDQVQLQRCSRIKQMMQIVAVLSLLTWSRGHAKAHQVQPAEAGQTSCRVIWKIALQGEFDKLKKAKDETEKQAASLKNKQEYAHTKASERLKKLKDHKSAAALDAIANMTKNSQFFRANDLSDHAVHQIQHAEEKMTRCVGVVVNFS